MSETKGDDHPLPCEAPCEKCGSGDARRQFFAKGEPVERRSHTSKEAPWPRHAVGNSWGFRAIKDFIGCRCRCCGHRFALKPLPKKKRASKSAASPVDDLLASVNKLRHRIDKRHNNKVEAVLHVGDDEVRASFWLCATPESDRKHIVTGFGDNLLEAVATAASTYGRK